jgi:phosphatidylglycerophosphate synthase
VTGVLARIGVRPIHLNVLAFAFGLLCAIFVAQGRLDTGAVLLALSTLADGLDGALACSLRMDSNFGAFVDSVFDRYIDLAILLAVLWYFRYESPKYLFLAYATIIGTVVTSYSRARGEGLGMNAVPKGLLSRAERMLFVIIRVRASGNASDSYLDVSSLVKYNRYSKDLAVLQPSQQGTTQ